MGWTTSVVCAHARRNPLSVEDLAVLIRTTHGALAGLSRAVAATPTQEPAVPVARSVTPDFIVCLEDGRKLRMLRRHLKTAYDMTPEQYRDKWGLPPDYPMVAPNYARQRSALAKRIGLGRRARDGGEA